MAERFGATPFDIEGVFWSHRGERCTFDVMLEEFGLRVGGAAPPGADRARRRYRAARTWRRRRPGCSPRRSACRACIRDDLAQLEAGDGPLRRVLPLVPRRGRRDAQLAARPEAGRRDDASVDDAPTADGAGARLSSLRRGDPGLGADRLLSFGGPAGQIALMHREVVDEKRWVGDARFLHALNFCTLLPGPEAQQLATYLGWLMHGVKGGLAAGLLFVLPGAVVMLALSLIYAAFGRGAARRRRCSSG